MTCIAVPRLTYEDAARRLLIATADLDDDTFLTVLGGLIEKRAALPAEKLDAFANAMGRLAHRKARG